MHNSNYSKEMRDMARHAFETGLSYRFVAQALNIPLYTAREWQASLLRGELQWTDDKHIRKIAEVSTEEKIDFLTQIAAGRLSVKAVARECGVAPSTVRYWRKTLWKKTDEDAPPLPAFPSSQFKKNRKKDASDVDASAEPEQLALF